MAEPAGRVEDVRYLAVFAGQPFCSTAPRAEIHYTMVVIRNAGQKEVTVLMVDRVGGGRDVWAAVDDTYCTVLYHCCAWYTVAGGMERRSRMRGEW